MKEQLISSINRTDKFSDELFFEILETTDVLEKAQFIEEVRRCGLGRLGVGERIGGEQAPVQIVDDVAPLAVARLGIAVEADVAGVGVHVEHLEEEIVDHVVDIDLREHDI